MKNLGINTVEDFFLNFPFRYEDKSQIVPIHLFSLQQINTSEGILSAVKNGKTKTGKSIQKAVFTDITGAHLDCVWFHQPFLARQFPFEEKVLISGKIKMEKGNVVFIAPTVEKIEQQSTLHTGGIIPIYHETDGLSSKWIREKIFPLLPTADAFEDILPEEIRALYSFPKKSEVIKTLHFPKSSVDLEKAKSAMAFEELFLLQLSALQQKKSWEHQGGAVGIPLDAELMKFFQEKLPFTLTDDQKITLYQILKDLEKTSPMLRLLQGDVGSGKTVVAAMAMLPFLKHGYQCVIMSPTEILAKQHYQTLQKLLKEYSPVLLVGSLSAKEKKEVQEKTSNGKLQLLVGTHALVQEFVSFPRLAFAVIDEQHRFGVIERGRLIKKSMGPVPHLLMMSATPIPRTLALTIFGDQELSIINQMPPGRKPVITKIVHPEARKQARLFIDDQISKGRQVFVVCPLIEESEKLEAKSVLQEYERLRIEDFPHRKIQYLHGKMRAEEKDRVMKDFQEKRFDILVSTSVVEVGIDIPNATIMIIEGAERFGLSQLHQFRGRVGRNDIQSYCFLFTTKKEQQSSRRLRAMVDYTDGFKLAEIDLEIRGPGEVYGLRQSGFPDLKIASLMDSRTIARARQQAAQFLEQHLDFSSFPELQKMVEKMGTFYNS